MSSADLAARLEAKAQECEEKLDVVDIETGLYQTQSMVDLLREAAEALKPQPSALAQEEAERNAVEQTSCDFCAIHPPDFGCTCPQYGRHWRVVD